MRRNVPLVAFNKGVVSPLALARTNLDAVALAAEIQTNFIPRSFGSMMLRPGLGYLFDYPGDTIGASSKSLVIPFIYDNDDTVLIIFGTGGGHLFFSVDDALLAWPDNMPGVGIGNGSFSLDLNSWTDNDDAGATSSWVADFADPAPPDGYMSLVGTGFAYARRYQLITVAAENQGIEHAILVVIERGEVTVSIGSNQGDDNYFTESILTRGKHIITFTPTRDFYIDVASNTKYATLIDTIASQADDTVQLSLMELADDDYASVRYVQSSDVVYLASSKPPLKIERRSARTWSLVYYQPKDGPFLPYNQTGITLSSSAISGDVTLTASLGLFRSTHVGALFLIDSVGQEVSGSFTAENQFTSDIRVFGTTRPFFVVLSGTWTATVTLQRSVGVTGSWVDVTTYTGNGTVAYDDALDNQIIFYRLGVKTGDFTSGTVVASLEYSQGSIPGVCLITAVASTTSASAAVLIDFGGTEATLNWREGAWSAFRGYPSGVEIKEGRLWWGGKQQIKGSVSDDYESFDPAVVGDSAPISRSIGYGPIDRINWLISLQRLFIGTAASEVQAKSSSFDEPLTQTAFSLSDASTQGSANVRPAKLDNSGLFVQRSGTSLYRLFYDGDAKDYASADMNILSPEVTEAGIKQIAVQRQPDTRVHCILNDGTAAVFMQDPAENIAAWIPITTDGLIQEVVILPGTGEDKVYYVVKRTIDSVDYFYTEKWALESECQGGDLNKQADSFVIYDGVSTTTPFTTELLHLTGKTVVIWADGNYIGTDTVTAGGALTSALATAATKVVAGLTYTAQFKSVKLAYGAALGTALTQAKQIGQLGLILSNTHASGIEFGGDFSHLHTIPNADLPTSGGSPDTDHLFPDYDLNMIPFNDKWSTDSRLCLQATAPKPCTVLAAIIGLSAHDK